MWREDNPSSLMVHSDRLVRTGLPTPRVHRPDTPSSWSASCLRLRPQPLTNEHAYERQRGPQVGRLGVFDKWVMCSFHHQCYRHTVLLSYTVLQTDSVAAQAVATKAKGERGCVLQSPWLQGVLPRGQRWSPWWQRSQKLTVDLPSDLLYHALTNLLYELLQVLHSDSSCCSHQPWYFYSSHSSFSPSTSVLLSLLLSTFLFVCVGSRRGLGGYVNWCPVHASSLLTISSPYLDWTWGSGGRVRGGGVAIIADLWLKKELLS